MIAITLFDLHCDTLVKAYTENQRLYDGRLHINLKKAENIKNYKQCFAVWIDDKFKGRSAFSFCNKIIDFYRKELVKGKKDNLISVLTIENGSALMGELDNIPYFANKGVKMMTLTWNGENELGYGVGANSEEGLKPFGKSAIGEMERRGVTVDVSHLNEDGFKDVVRFSSVPFVASHSGCYSLMPHKRNLKDWQIKEIISRGGLIGVPLCEDFIEGGREKLYRHICHILSLGGENSVALGSDFDGCRIHYELSGLEKVGELYSFLCESDMGKEITDKVFHLNAEKFFKDKL